MKKHGFLLLAFAFISVLANAQNSSVYFNWTPTGTLLTSDGKDYVIKEYEGKSKEELYNELLVSVSSLFNDPKHVVSTVENQLININAGQMVEWPYGGLLGIVPVNMQYVLKIHFKDNKIKIDAPYFTSITVGGTPVYDIEGWAKAQKFFNPDGTFNTKKGKSIFCRGVNIAFNNLIEAILSYNKTNNDW